MVYVSAFCVVRSDNCFLAKTLRCKGSLFVVYSLWFCILNSAFCFLLSHYCFLAKTLRRKVFKVLCL